MKSTSVACAFTMATIVTLPASGAGVTSGAADTRIARHYAVMNLGTFGGAVGSANSINERGWVTGSANLTGNVITHAALWRRGEKLDLGTLGGPNSSVDWPNHNNFGFGFIAGISETSKVDPLREKWSCSGFFAATGHVCLGFVWQAGVMTALPTLGGINGYAAGTNNLGTVVGWAETAKHDPTCTGAQVLQFEPAVWDPYRGVRELPTYRGDPDGAATAINDLDQIVGISGICDRAIGRFSATHAVLRQHGTVTNIGDFGGTSWNTPTAINNRGEVVGFANLPGDTQGQLQPSAFLWTKSKGMQRLGTLRGDEYSLAEGINDRGQIVGVSYSANFATSRAFIWQDGVMTDLNSLVPAKSSLYLIAANDINDRGEIVGQAMVRGTLQTPAFSAVPRQCEDLGDGASTGDLKGTIVPKVMLPEHVRRELQRQLRVDTSYATVSGGGAGRLDTFSASRRRASPPSAS